MGRFVNSKDAMNRFHEGIISKFNVTCIFDLTSWDNSFILYSHLNLEVAMQMSSKSSRQTLTLMKGNHRRMITIGI